MVGSSSIWVTADSHARTSPLSARLQSKAQGKAGPGPAPAPSPRIPRPLPQRGDVRLQPGPQLLRLRRPMGG